MKNIVFLPIILLGGATVLSLCLILGCDGEKPVTPEIEIEAELIAITESPSPVEIYPYVEALVTYEWKILRVTQGALDGDRALVAHWAVLGGQTQTPVGELGVTRKFTIVPLEGIPGMNTVERRDDLPLRVELPIFLDLSQSLTAATMPRQVRNDYRGSISQRMQTYWLLRHQLRLVVIGNSHALAGVKPEALYLPENAETPVALNMAEAGSGMDLQCLVASEYAANLPEIEWVIWGTSPRLFNGRNAHDRRGELFESSPGRRYDVAHWNELWPVAEGLPRVTVKDHKAALGKGRSWGWASYRNRTLPNPMTPEGEEAILAQAVDDRFKPMPELWDQFENVVAELTGRGIKVLIFTPPFHPVVARAHNADFDGTGRGAYKEIVARLTQLADANPLVFFEDIHRGGDHPFADEVFADPDHLLPDGAAQLSEVLRQFIDTHSDSRDVDGR